MRLGIDASNLRAGGGITHLRELLKHADPTIYSFEQVFVWGGSALLNQLEDQPWLDIIHEPLLDQPLPKRLYWQYKILPRLAKNHCDLLFVPGSNSALTAFHPIVTMCRNMLPFESRERSRYKLSYMRLRNELLHGLQKRSFEQADGVIFLSQYARETVQRSLRQPPRQSVIIPHGITREFYKPPRSSRPLIDYARESPFRWVYVSILDVYKHQIEVAEAAALLHTQGLPLCVEFYGPQYPPYTHIFLNTLAQLDPVGKFLRYHGKADYHQLPAIYQQADGFIFASSCENLPNILLEAMAAGLPIACSNQGPMPEVLSDAGVYFDPESAADTAQAMSQLMHSPDLRSRCAALAYQQAQGYSWERCAHETFTFLAQVIRQQ